MNTRIKHLSMMLMASLSLGLSAQGAEFLTETLLEAFRKPETHTEKVMRLAEEKKHW